MKNTIIKDRLDADMSLCLLRLLYMLGIRSSISAKTPPISSPKLGGGKFRMKIIGKKKDV